MDISLSSILRYIFHIKPHFSIFFYCEVVSKRILIMFAPEETEIFKDYLFILAWFSVRLPLFSYDWKTIFVFWRRYIYFNKNKIGKINTRKQPPWRQKLLSDKQIKFKKFCVSWNKFHKNRRRDGFKFFFWKMWFYMKYIVKNRRWRILMSVDCI